jgi:hypothetical protein
MLIAPGTFSTTSSTGWRMSSRNGAPGVLPVSERHVTMQNVGGDHPGEVDGVLRAAELGRIAKLGFREVVDRRAKLDSHGQRADALVDRRRVLAEGLCSEQTPVGPAEENLQSEHLGARVLAGTRIREEIDLLAVLVAESFQRLFADPGPRRGATEQAGRVVQRSAPGLLRNIVPRSTTARATRTGRTPVRRLSTAIAHDPHGRAEASITVRAAVATTAHESTSFVRCTVCEFATTLPATFAVAGEILQTREIWLKC